MARITVKHIDAATEDNKPTVITDDTGAKMSGFDTALRAIQPGDILDVEIKPKGKFNNIVSFKVLEKAAGGKALSAAPPSASPALIEAQYRVAALQCAVSLVAAGKIGDMRETIVHADQYYCWLKDIPAPAVKASGAMPPVEKNDIRIDKTLGPVASALLRQAQDERTDSVKTEPEELFPSNQEIVRQIYELIRTNLKIRGDGGISSWLENVFKLEMSRLETEPAAVLKDIEKYFAGKQGARGG